MKNPRWEKLKHEALLRAKGHCEDGCGARLKRGHWHLHHLTYARRGKELLSDVRAICLACHGRRHPNHTFLTPEMQRAISTARKKRQAFRTNRPPPKPHPVEQYWDDFNGKLLADIKMVRGK